MMKMMMMIYHSSCSPLIICYDHHHWSGTGQQMSSAVSGRGWRVSSQCSCCYSSAQKMKAEEYNCDCGLTQTCYCH